MQNVRGAYRGGYRTSKLRKTVVIKRVASEVYQERLHIPARKIRKSSRLHVSNSDRYKPSGSVIQTQQNSLWTKLASQTGTDHNVIGAWCPSHHAVALNMGCKLLLRCKMSILGVQDIKFLCKVVPHTILRQASASQINIIVLPTVRKPCQRAQTKTSAVPKRHLWLTSFWDFCSHRTSSFDYPSSVTSAQVQWKSRRLRTHREISSYLWVAVLAYFLFLLWYLFFATRKNHRNKYNLTGFTTEACNYAPPLITLAMSKIQRWLVDYLLEVSLVQGRKNGLQQHTV